eukprot:5225844-Prymnesium_polylepis.1
MAAALGDGVAGFGRAPARPPSCARAGTTEATCSETTFMARYTVKQIFDAPRPNAARDGAMDEPARATADARVDR